MQITINDKTYDIENMTPEAQSLVLSITNANNQQLAYRAAAEFFGNQLAALLEANQPIDSDETDSSSEDS